MQGVGSVRLPYHKPCTDYHTKLSVRQKSLPLPYKIFDRYSMVMVHTYKILPIYFFLFTKRKIKKFTYQPFNQVTHCSKNKIIKPFNPVKSVSHNHTTKPTLKLLQTKVKKKSNLVYQHYNSLVIIKYCNPPTKVQTLPQHYHR